MLAILPAVALSLKLSVRANHPFSVRGRRRHATPGEPVGMGGAEETGMAAAAFAAAALKLAAKPCVRASYEHGVGRRLARAGG